MKHRVPFLLVCFIAACGMNAKVPAARNPAWATAVKETAFKNGYQLNDSIYRSEQPKEQHIEDLKKLGIKSVLDLRANHSDSSVLRENQFNYYHVEFVTRHFTDTEIIQALRIIRQAPKPLLVHCKRGSDRTGVVMAMYRIVFENWAKQTALDEMTAGNYGFHQRFKNIPEYIQNVNADSLKRLVFK